MRDKRVVGTGKLMPGLKKVHGRRLTKGWVAVEVVTLKQRNLSSWDEFPTHSECVEEGSYSAWPETEVRPKATPTPLLLPPTPPPLTAG